MDKMQDSDSCDVGSIPVDCIQKLLDFPAAFSLYRIQVAKGGFTFYDLQIA